MTFGGRPKSPPWVLIVRLALLLVTGAAVLFSYGIPSGTEKRRASGRQIYACPMHPEARATVPGTCAICGMALEPVSVDSANMLVAPARLVAPSPKGNISSGGQAAEQLLFTAEIRAPAWVEAPGLVMAHVYDDELPWVASESHGSFSLAAVPFTRVDIQRFEGPPVAWDRSTSTVRFQLDPSADLSMGAVGWVSFPAKPRSALIVPAAGVLEGADGPYVIVLGPGETYDWRPVRIGKILNRYAFVVSGLRDHERVAVNDAFLLDAERRVHGIPELVRTTAP